MSNAEKEGQTKSLDKFSGQDTSDYGRWRRRAELYLAALPTTIPEKKWGAKLMEHLSGEAEELMDQLAIEDLLKDDGYKMVLNLLDVQGANKR